MNDDVSMEEASPGPASGSTPKASIGSNSTMMSQEKLYNTTPASPQNAEAVDGCLAAACRGLHFDFAEVWRRDSLSGNKFTCVHQYSAPRRATSPLSRLNAVSMAARTKFHSLSPQLCSRGMKEKVPLWYTPAHQGTPLHPEIPINTAVVMPTFSFEIQQEFYVIYFAFDKMESSSAKLAYLRFLAKAAVVASGIAFFSAVNPPPLPPCLEQQPPGEKINDISVVCAHPELPDYFLQWTDLKHVEHLCEGGNSIIYTAEYNDQLVIAKILRQDCEKNELRVREIHSEIELMQSFHHPNIAKFYGSGTEPRTFMVMELLDGGSLNQRLGFVPKYGGAHRTTFHFRDTRKPFSYTALLRCAFQLADALRYLHEEAVPGFRVLHRDLKPDNIGFKADGTLKLIDFGLAKTFPRNATDKDRYRMTGETGSIRYMAPEVALNRPYDHKVDVYSFAFIVWEMATMHKPFEGFGRQEFYHCVIRGGDRPALNRKWPKGFTALLESCWDVDPKKRPDFKEVVEILQNLIRQQEESAKGSGGRWTLLSDRNSSWF